MSLLDKANRILEHLENADEAVEYEFLVSLESAGGLYDNKAEKEICHIIKHGGRLAISNATLVAERMGLYGTLPSIKQRILYEAKNKGDFRIIRDCLFVMARLSPIEDIAFLREINNNENYITHSTMSIVSTIERIAMRCN